ncbi:MAG: oligosaccharide flippase family protein [Elusimicrobiota bacterium]|jgi:O-antigen/teichoic acid export membrane protein
MSRGGGFTRDVAGIFLNQAFLLGAGILTGVLTARGLGPDGRGLYAIALLFPSFLSSMLPLGLNFANLYLVNREGAPPGRLAFNTIAYSASSGLLFTLGLVMFSASLSASFAGGEGRGLIALAAAALIPSMLFENVYYLLLGRRDIKGMTAMNLARAAAYAALLGGMFIFPGFTPGKAVMAYLGGLGAGLILGFARLKKNGFLSDFRPSRTHFGAALGYGIRQHPSSVLQFLTYRTDLFIVGAFLPASEAGLYAAAVVIAELLWQLPAAAAQVLFPKVAASSEKESGEFTPQVVRHVLLISGVSAAGLFLAAGYAVTLLYGTEFSGAALPLRILLPGAVLMGLSKMLGSDIAARGRPGTVSMASAASFITAAWFGIALTPLFGLPGAALATSAAYAVNSAVMTLSFLRISGKKAADIFVFKKEDLSVYRGLKSRIFPGLR